MEMLNSVSRADKRTRLVYITERLREAAGEFLKKKKQNKTAQLSHQCGFYHPPSIAVPTERIGQTQFIIHQSQMREKVSIKIKI